MNRHCEGLILSKKGFGSGHLILNFLDKDKGKIKLTAYGAALETGSRRSNILSGSFIQGLTKTSHSEKPKEVISDIVTIFSINFLSTSLKATGFAFFALEILDLFLMEEIPFPYYDELFDTFLLFNDTLDEKYILFFLVKFLSQESWMIPQLTAQLNPQTQRFIHDAHNKHISFLQGKNISSPRKQELSFFLANLTKNIRGTYPKSFELLRFESESL
ncbi:MAG: hypothetical protein ACRCTQ_04000 [Brevinemataceae bacterium]